MTERSRSDWNAVLTAWEQPASNTEEAKIERAATMVRAAVGRSDWIVSQGVSVLPQGSYFNNTNVRLDADMDLRAVHPLKHYVYLPGVIQEYADSALKVAYSGETFEAVSARMRTELAAELGRAFGAANVDASGDKAIQVKELPGSRAKVDIVPAFMLREVSWNSNASRYDVTHGVTIVSKSWKYTYNFPDQHHENGKSKRAATAQRFKKVVRMLKWMRGDLPHFDPAWCPSFLVECLVYAVEDDYFLVERDDRYDRLRRIVYRLGEKLADAGWRARAAEINGVKLLFGPHQPWTPEGAAAFVEAAWKRLEP